MKRISRHHINILIPAVLIVAIVISALIVSHQHTTTSKVKTTAMASIGDVCTKTNTVTFSCYKKELHNLTVQQGPERAMALIKQQYSNVSYVKSQCHQLTHVIGRSAYEKYGNITDTFAHGDQYCWSGYYHGAMEQLTNEKGYDYTVNNASSICSGIANKQKYSFYHYNCVHGLGHGFMFVLDGDIFKGLDACNRLTDSWEAQSCYGGIFMQNIMNVQGPDANSSVAPKYLKPDQPMYPCTAVDNKYKLQCYLMQTSYALQTVNYNFAKVFTLCDGVEEAYRDTCYQSTGRDASGHSISDSTITKNTCLLGKDQRAQENCIVGAAKDFVSYYHSDVQAKQLCSIFPIGLQPNCYQTVKTYYATF
jgi:hypothetical protein